jgi:ribosomal protein S8
MESFCEMSEANTPTSTSSHEDPDRDSFADQEDFSCCTKYQKSQSGERTHIHSVSQSKSKSQRKSLKRWTSEEDQLLLDLFYKIGNDWKEIAKHMTGRAPSAVKNRFYWIYNSKLPVQTLQKIKNTCQVKKLYKSPVNSSELFRKINNYLSEEGIFQSFLVLDTPEPYDHLVHKLNMTPQNLENHAKMQKLIEQAQYLYKSCEKAKANLALFEKEIGKK